MTEQHPITPPPELVQTWLGKFFGCTPNPELSASERFLANKAAQWGADQELEACCEWISNPDTMHLGPSDLRASRRPKPPSLKKQALADFNWLIGRTVGNPKADARSKRILQALESLSDD